MATQMNRARFLARGGAIAAAYAVAGPAFAAPAADPDRSRARERALLSYAAMQRAFYSPESRSYARDSPGALRAQAWPYSQALWATIEIARLPGAGREFRGDLLERVAGLSAYRRSEPGRIEYASLYGANGDVYYDDNLWIALALVEASDLVDRPDLISTARRLFALVSDGWDANAADACPGGVFWARTGGTHDRNTVTTANGALLAVRLFERTHAAGYLAWAQRAYGWVRSCLGASGGLVADHLDATGAVDPRTWSYNQGAMIATAVRLFRATGDPGYLQDARMTASATLAEVGDPLGSGEPAVFLAIFYRDLLELAEVDPGRNDRAALRTFADEAWSRRRDPATGVFHFSPGGGTLLDQAAMVQVFAQLVES